MPAKALIFGYKTMQKLPILGYKLLHWMYWSSVTIHPQCNRRCRLNNADISRALEVRASVTLPPLSPSYGDLGYNRKVVIALLLEKRDAELLRLAGRYRWLPYQKLERFHFDGIVKEIDKLSRMHLLTISRSREYISLASLGYEILDDLGYDYTPSRKRAFAGSSALRRRLEASMIMLTCLRAGIDTLSHDENALSRQPVFKPGFEFRPEILNCANCAGFAHLGDVAFMLQYVSPESCGMYMTNETNVFTNLSSIFDRRNKTPQSMILAGDNYTSVYRQLIKTTPSERHKKHGFMDFWYVYKNTHMPVHLLSCDELGARQLAVMSQSDYRGRIAKAAFGDGLTPYDEAIPEADGCVGNRPLVIAIDMDIQRISRVIMAAKSLKRPEVMVAALEGQIRELLIELFPPGRGVTLLSIEDNALNAAFSQIALNNMNSNAPAYDARGGVIHA